MMGLSAPYKSGLKVVQCDQTSVCAASIMMKVKKYDDSYKGRSIFILISGGTAGNRIDCSVGGVFARWRRVGILSLA
jgi:hypothetical protein